MDSQDHKLSSNPTGHGGHDVHLCHRCGWPFPNPHPSAKHRRAHKRVCGSIEGYKVILSEEHDHHLTVSDGEHTSDEDDQHTPSGHKSQEKNGNEFGSSGGVGEKSNKTEDDVFADAAMEFGDSGNSLRLPEQGDTLSGLDKSTEEKPVKIDVDGGVSLEVGVNTDKEISKPGAPVNAVDLSKNVGLVTDEKAEATAVGISSGLQPDDVKSVTPIEVVDDIKEVAGIETQDSGKKSRQDIDMEGEDNATGNLNSEEAIISGHTLVAADKDSCDKFVSESKLVNHDLSLETENPKDIEAYDGVETVTGPVESACFNKPVYEIGIVDENHENNATVGLKEIDTTAGDIGTVDIVGKDLAEESLSSGPTHKPSGSANPADTAEPYDVVSSIDKKLEQEASLGESENPDNFDTSKRGKCGVAGNEVGNLEFEDKFSTGSISTARNNDQTTTGLKEHGNKCEENPNLKSSESESEKGGVEASLDAEAIFDSKLSSEKSTDIRHSCEAELSHDDVQKENFPLATTKDDDTSLPELPNQIHVRSDGGTENVPVTGTFTELKDNEQLISKDSTASLTGSKLTGNFAEENSCLDEGVSAEPHKSNVVVPVANSERSNASLNITSPDIENGKTSEDASMSQVVGIVLGAERTSDGNVVESDECSPTGDDMNIIDVNQATSTKSLQDKGDDNKLTGSKHGVADHFGSSSSICDSLEGNCGSIAEAISESTYTNSQRHETATVEAHLDTLVQSGGDGNKAAEAETSQNNPHPNKNKQDKVIAKVTNWGSEKQHSPLKDLLDDVKPSTKQDPAENQKGEAGTKDNGVGPEAALMKDSKVNKDIEEWNSPARYPIEDKKVKKKKGKSYWVPFVCCSSVHRDL